MNMKHAPTIRKPGEGRTIRVLGDVYRFLATGDNTDGKYAMWEPCLLPANLRESSVWIETEGGCGGGSGEATGY